MNKSTSALVPPVPSRLGFTQLLRLISQYAPAEMLSLHRPAVQPLSPHPRN